MKHRMLACSAVLAGAIVMALGVSTADALNKNQQKCLETVAKEGGKFIKATLKERAKCADKNLKETGSCDFVKRDAKLDKAETKLRAGIQKKCGDPFSLPVFSLQTIGYPGKCPDPDPSNGFTVQDLQDCMFETHTDQVLGLFDLQYGANGDDGVDDLETQTGDASLAKDLGKCQKEIGKNGLKHVLTIQKEVSKCRNKIQKNIDKDPPVGPNPQPVNCANNVIDPKPKEKIAKSRTKLIAKISDKCAGLLGNAAMDVCDTGGGPETDAGDAATCIADTHTNATDDPTNDGTGTPFAVDFIDFEYRASAFCGDGITNDQGTSALSGIFIGFPTEECDGADDGNCPGECGGVNSAWPCLCMDTPRERVDEQDNSDLDNGWSGTSHDSTVVQGSGYWADLYDCDGPGGSDPVCRVGPSCNNSPNQACVSDAQCGGVGNFCRKTSLAVGPHCSGDIQKTCSTLAQCGGEDGYCKKTPHGIPLPLSSGGISVCVVNIFSEDVVGTTNLDTGSFSIRLRQDSVTHLGGGGKGRNHPCPTCGGYCNAQVGSDRALCQADSDCPASQTCVTDAVCSSGENIDKPCRPNYPYGGATALFGNPSIDCPPTSGADVSNGGLDILFAPSTSGTTTNPPDTNCITAGFNTKKCIAGADTGKSCTVDSNCTGGGVGSCQHQCPCPATGGTAAQPNGCFAACRGGSNDFAQCSVDSQCPGGFCQQASCRSANGVCRDGTNIGGACGADSDCPGGTCGDNDSTDEGFCPAGPLEGRCSTSTFVPCNATADCLHSIRLCIGGANDGLACSAPSNCPDGTCSDPCDECLKNNSETCVTTNRDCFQNEGATRTGAAGIPLRVGVAQYCIPTSGAPSVDSVAGLPGPGALSQPAITTPIGF